MTITDRSGSAGTQRSSVRRSDLSGVRAAAFIFIVPFASGIEASINLHEMPRTWPRQRQERATEKYQVPLAAHIRPSSSNVECREQSSTDQRNSVSSRPICGVLPDPRMFVPGRRRRLPGRKESMIQIQRSQRQRSQDNRPSRESINHALRVQDAERPSSAAKARWRGFFECKRRDSSTSSVCSALLGGMNIDHLTL